ncbi:MAG: hypothetical protein ACJARN_000926 [Arenicella sp.]|jgi:hypothetical protein
MVINTNDALGSGRFKAEIEKALGSRLGPKCLADRAYRNEDLGLSPTYAV